MVPDNKTIICTLPLHDNGGFAEKVCNKGYNLVVVEHAKQFADYPDAAIYIDARFNGYFCPGAFPLLFHAPAYSFKKLPEAPLYAARFCAWPGFWERDGWEIATLNENSIKRDNFPIFTIIKPIFIKDVVGLIAPRILCTLINEAAYTLMEGVSSESDIDTAMKLGTNYPKGPLEWAQLIGFEEVNKTLTLMAEEDERYRPHPHLQKLFN